MNYAEQTFYQSKVFEEADLRETDIYYSQPIDNCAALLREYLVQTSFVLQDSTANLQRLILWPRHLNLTPRLRLAQPTAPPPCTALESAQLLEDRFLARPLILGDA